MNDGMPMALFFAAWAALVVSAACGATSQEPCTEADLGKVVAAHEARLAMKCVGQGPDCPERKAEDARFKEEIRTWVRCDKESEPPR
jgi:hypothetical protein